MAPSDAPNRIGASRSVTLSSSTAPSPRQSSRQEQPTAEHEDRREDVELNRARRPSEAIFADCRLGEVLYFLVVPVPTRHQAAWPDYPLCCERLRVVWDCVPRGSAPEAL